MPRRQPLRLRETPDAPASNGAIIDADFKVVGKAPGVWRGLWRALLAIFWAALIGLLLPPAWVLVNAIRDYLAGR